MARRHVRILTFTAVLATALVLPSVGVEAVQAPQTLTARAPVDAVPVEVDFDIEHVAVVWDAPGSDGHADGHGHDDEPHGAVRLRVDGEWGRWQALVEDGAEAPGQWGSALVAADDADAYQVRGVPDDAQRPRAVALNTTDGPPVTVGTRTAGAASGLSDCRSRADWGAEEDLRDWAPDFHDVQVTTVHHTVTDNDDPDPESTVRAIYEYHAVDRGWGDIGYHYLVDEQGVVYEGRWSGTDSTSCDAGGDGSDFAHGGEGGEQMVTAAHVGGQNSGNLGVALLGEFTDHPRFGGEPTADARDALDEALAELMDRHGLDPQGRVTFTNPVSDDETEIETISGHRDWSSTECPGETLYEQLPDIRQAVAERMGSDDESGEEDEPEEEEPETTTGVSVDSIEQSTTGGPKGRHLVVEAHLVDAEGAPVEGAEVDLEVERGTDDDMEDSTVYASVTETTDSHGTATLKLTNAPSGCYSSTITGVRAGDDWDGDSPSPEPDPLCK